MNDAILAIIAGVMCVADLLTGWAKAIVQKNLNSSISRNGILKKGVELLLIGLAYGVDWLLKTAFFYEIMAIYYAANEALSVLENAGALGLPIPMSIKNRIEKLKEETDNDEKD